MSVPELVTVATALLLSRARQASAQSDSENVPDLVNIYLHDPIYTIHNGEYM